MSVRYESHLNDVLQAIDEAQERALLAVAIFLKAKAILKSPVGRISGGDLRQSIKYELDDNKILIGSTSKYAVYVEKGTGIYAEDGNGRTTPWVYYDQKAGEYFLTRGQKPQPFLTPAVFENIEEIKSIFVEEMKNLEN